MDDNSRFFMLEVFCGALLRYPPPKILYLDNGSCYRGEILGLLCKRLEIQLVHATPYNPQARGKMERQRCTDHISNTADIHQVDQALWSWLDVDYHRHPHAGLITPRNRYLKSLSHQGIVLTPAIIAKALEVSLQRQVRRDGTFSVEGVIYEVSGHHLINKTIELIIDGLTNRPIRAFYQKQKIRFGLCDPVINSHRKKKSSIPIKESNESIIPFDPIATLLAKAREVLTKVSQVI